MSPTVGKFCTPEKPIRFTSSRKTSMGAEGIGAVDPGDNRRVLDHRQHFARHVHHDRIGIAIGHEPGERAATGHAEAAGIVDDDEIDAAGLLAFGGKARAGAAADDRLAPARSWRDSVSRRSDREKLGIGQLLPDAPRERLWCKARKCWTSAEAKAGSLMWCGSRMICRLAVTRTVS